LNYPENFETKIGFDRIRESVSKLCLSESARQMLDEQGYLTDYELIREKLLRTKECMVMMGEEEFTIEPYPDITHALAKLTVTGSFLELEEVSALRKNLDAVRNILNFFKKTDRQEKFPAIFGMSRDVKIYPFILERIDKVLSKNGKIRDNASRELARIRVDLAGKEKQVARRLQHILKSVQQEGIAESDVTVSIRNGRPVIPVQASKKRQLSRTMTNFAFSNKQLVRYGMYVDNAKNAIRTWQKFMDLVFQNSNKAQKK